ncbi:hypothetical protein [Streptomyces albidochromogenes]|uniref:Uncharacterized protein n=1 Tax=Streptomyces albidochromogenes TaxID=329524 RepID=A0ABW6FG32_9ACTN|nr:hypothetical protein [Streptomyces albidochromogenes]
MTSKQPQPLAPRVVRQLRRTRSVYAAGIALWGIGATLEVWQRPGSHQMWVFLLFLTVFTGLLVVTSWWLWRHQDALRVVRREARVAGARR